MSLSRGGASTVQLLPIKPDPPRPHILADEHPVESIYSRAAARPGSAGRGPFTTGERSYEEAHFLTAGNPGDLGAGSSDRRISSNQFVKLVQSEAPSAVRSHRDGRDPEEDVARASESDPFSPGSPGLQHSLTHTGLVDEWGEPPAQHTNDRNGGIAAPPAAEQPRSPTRTTVGRHPLSKSSISPPQSPELIGNQSQKKLTPPGHIPKVAVRPGSISRRLSTSTGDLELRVRAARHALALKPILRGKASRHSSADASVTPAPSLKQGVPPIEGARQQPCPLDNLADAITAEVCEIIVGETVDGLIAEAAPTGGGEGASGAGKSRDPTRRPDVNLELPVVRGVAMSGVAGEAPWLVVVGDKSTRSTEHKASSGSESDSSGIGRPLAARRHSREGMGIDAMSVSAAGDLATHHSLQDVTNHNANAPLSRGDDSRSTADIKATIPTKSSTSELVERVDATPPPPLPTTAAAPPREPSTIALPSNAAASGDSVPVDVRTEGRNGAAEEEGKDDPTDRKDTGATSSNPTMATRGDSLNSNSTPSGLGFTFTTTDDTLSTSSESNPEVSASPSSAAPPPPQHVEAPTATTSEPAPSREHGIPTDMLSEDRAHDGIEAQHAVQHAGDDTFLTAPEDRVSPPSPREQVPGQRDAGDRAAEESAGFDGDGGPPPSPADAHAPAPPEVDFDTHLSREATPSDAPSSECAPKGSTGAVDGGIAGEQRPRRSRKLSPSEKRRWGGLLRPTAASAAKARAAHAASRGASESAARSSLRYPRGGTDRGGAASGSRRRELRQPRSSKSPTSRAREVRSRPSLLDLFDSVARIGGAEDGGGSDGGDGGRDDGVWEDALSHARAITVDHEPAATDHDEGATMADTFPPQRGRVAPQEQRRARGARRPKTATLLASKGRGADQRATPGSTPLGSLRPASASVRRLSLKKRGESLLSHDLALRTPTREDDVRVTAARGGLSATIDMSAVSADERYYAQALEKKINHIRKVPEKIITERRTPGKSIPLWAETESPPRPRRPKPLRRGQGKISSKWSPPRARPHDATDGHAPCLNAAIPLGPRGDNDPDRMRDRVTQLLREKSRAEEVARAALARAAEIEEEIATLVSRESSVTSTLDE